MALGNTSLLLFHLCLHYFFNKNHLTSPFAQITSPFAQTKLIFSCRLTPAHPHPSPRGYVTTRKSCSTSPNGYTPASASRKAIDARSTLTSNGCCLQMSCKNANLRIYIKFCKHAILGKARQSRKIATTTPLATVTGPHTSRRSAVARLSGR